MVAGRYEDLKKPLGTSFAADERAVRFCEGPGRQHKLGLFGHRTDEVIEHDHVGRRMEERLNVGARRAPVQIIFQNDERVGTAILDRLKRGAQRTRAHQTCTHGIALGRRKAEHALPRPLRHWRLPV